MNHSRSESLAIALGLAAVCSGASALAGDLPASGKYSAHYLWTFSGQVQELGANRMVYVGTLPGVVFNDAGDGFLNKTRADCTIVNDVNQGRTNATSTCAITDAQGDKAFLEYKCADASVSGGVSLGWRDRKIRWPKRQQQVPG